MSLQDTQFILVFKHTNIELWSPSLGIYSFISSSFCVHKKCFMHLFGISPLEYFSNSFLPHSSVHVPLLTPAAFIQHFVLIKNIMVCLSSIIISTLSLFLLDSGSVFHLHSIVLPRTCLENLTSPLHLAAIITQNSCSSIRK